MAPRQSQLVRVDRGDGHLIKMNHDAAMEFISLNSAAGARIVEQDVARHRARLTARSEAALDGLGESEEDEQDLESMTVAELREYADENNIDLGVKTIKREIIQAIQAAEEDDEED